MKNILLGALIGFVVALGMSGRTQDLPELAEPQSPPIWPAVFGGMAAVAVSQMGICATYPCAHVGHVVTGLAIGYFGTKYYGAPAALTVGISFAFVKELMDQHNGKAFRGVDVATRTAGTLGGIYLYREF